MIVFFFRRMLFEYVAIEIGHRTRKENDWSCGKSMIMRNDGGGKEGRERERGRWREREIGLER